MEIFLNVWNNWSLYQKVTTTLLLVLLFLIIILSVRFATKSKQYTIFTIISLIASALLTIASFVFVNVVFGTTITYMYMLAPIIILMINLFNISSSVGFYIKNKKLKKLDIDKLKKEFLMDTVHLTVLLIPMFSAFCVFITEPLLTFILLTMLVSIAVLWTNYSLIYWLFRKNA